MSHELFMTMVAVVCAVISITCFDYTRRQFKLRNQDREKAQAAADAVRDRIAAAVAAASGQYAIKQCQVQDIKFGETVCWRSEDWQEHEDYVAGYDGDPGPSADGFHGKPIISKGL